MENSHPAIIDPLEFQLVQREIARRKLLGRKYSGSSVLSCRIICADCGEYFGAKVWHSTSKYASVLGMNDAYSQLNHYVLVPILNRYQVPPKDQKYMIPFFINGLMAIINEWLKDDCKDSIEYIISIIQLCIKKI